MLLAKINPPAKTIRQNGPFSEAETVIGDYMKIHTERYDLGAEKTRFVVVFGYLIPFGVDQFKFESIHRDSIEFSKLDIQDWGLDDSYIFDIVATKLGIQVLSTEEKNITNDF